MENEKSARIQIGVVTRPPPGGCGCYLDHDRTRVTWCPLHAAAPALLEALRALANTADNADGNFTEYRQALRFSVQQARAAIAKATD